MAPKTDPTTSGGTTTTITLSDREQRVLCSALAYCTKAPVEIEYGKLAHMIGLKNGPSAKASWHGVKKKVKAIAGPAVDYSKETEDGGEGDGAATDEDEGGDESPVKKKKKGKASSGDAEAGKTDKAEKKKKRKADEADAKDADEGAEQAPEDKKKKSKKSKKGKKAVAEVKEEHSEGEEVGRHLTLDYSPTD